MKYIWEDLPKPMNCFTVRNATMRNLNTGEVVQHYSANTKIAVVQKCVTPVATYYRTESAKHHYLNFAFEASAFGLPNELAPSVPPLHPLSSSHKRKNKKSTPKIILPEDGAGRERRATLLKKLSEWRAKWQSK